MKRSKLLIIVTAVLLLSSCDQIKKIIYPSSSVASSSVVSSIENTSSVSPATNSSGVDIMTSDATMVYVYYVDLYDAPGDCSLIKYNNIEILVDAGTAGSGTVQHVTTALSSIITDGTIEYVVATHPDTDHYAGLPTVFSNYVIGTLFKYSTIKSNATMTKFDNAITAEGCTVNYIAEWFGDAETKNLVIDDNVQLVFYNTGSWLTGTDSNGSSIVFTLEAYDTRVFFSADTEADQEVVFAPMCGDVDVYAMGHHGSAAGTSSSMLNIMKPEIVIAPVGDFLGNGYKHPTYAAMSRVYAYSTDTKLYCMAGGSWSSSTKDNQRNGQINLMINDLGYALTCENYGSNLIEMRSTTYWQDSSNPYKNLYK